MSLFFLSLFRRGNGLSFISQDGLGVMRISEANFMKRVCESNIKGNGVRGRLSVKWINRVKECIREKEWAGEELNEQRGNARIGKTGDSSVVANNYI